MKHYSIRLTTLSPLAIRSDHAPTGAETATYISGTTLAGGLAAVYRLLYSGQQDEFDALFLRGQVSYPNLYPAYYGKADEVQALHGSLPVFPVPKTAQSCKRYKGFLYPVDEDDERHGVRDSLLDWAMFKLGSKNSPAGNTAALEALRRYKECPHVRLDTGKTCGATMDRFDGYYSWLDFYPYSPFSAQTEMRLQTHTGINRETGTVKEGILYNRRVFEEDMSFWGMATLPDDERLSEMFKTFIETANKDSLVRIGTGRTRGLGKVDLKVELIKEEDRFHLFKKRLLAFDDKLKSEASAYARGADLQSFYFALTLHSPVILYDSTLRYHTSIDGETLAQLVGSPTSTYEFKLIYQATGGRRLSGWNDLWGLPKTNEYAIDSGSVFLFASTTAIEEAFLRALFELEEQGIGRRRSEGFGRICFSDPFHMEVTLR